MPLELRPGSIVPIPCRHCDRTLIRFAILEGSHTLSCPKCGSVTEVRVYSEGGRLRVKTARGAVRAKPS